MPTRLGRRGFEVWADDAVAFKAGLRVITAIPLPFALRLRSEVADFFEVPTPAERPANGKTEALRHQAIGRRESLRSRCSSEVATRRFPIVGSRVAPGGPLSLLLLLARRSSVRRRMSTQFLELIAAAPVFRVSLRTGLEAMAGLLDDLERRVLTDPAV